MSWPWAYLMLRVPIHQSRVEALCSRVATGSRPYQHGRRPIALCSSAIAVVCSKHSHPTSFKANESEAVGVSDSETQANAVRLLLVATPG